MAEPGWEQGKTMKSGNHEISEIHPGIFRIPLPLPGDKPDHVNAYLFKGKHPLLFDTGMNRTFPDLCAAFKHLNMEFSDLGQIILSHGHFDHYGAAASILKHAGKPIPVLAHPDAVLMLAKGNGLGLTQNELLQFLKQTGLPLWLRIPVVLIAHVFNTFAGKIKTDVFMAKGDTLLAGDYPCQLIETPGHCKGLVCLYLPGQHLFFSSDHILPYLPHSDPFLFHFNGIKERFNQIEFFESLGRVADLKPCRIFPGHGDEIQDMDNVIRRYRTEYKKKDEKIIRALVHGPCSVYEIVKKIFPKVLNVRMGFPIYIALSEVYTHLQVLVRDSRVSRDDRNRVIRYLIHPDH